MIFAENASFRSYGRRHLLAVSPALYIHVIIIYYKIIVIRASILILNLHIFQYVETSDGFLCELTIIIIIIIIIKYKEKVLQWNLS